MIFAAVQSLTLPSLLALLFVALVAAGEVGHRLGAPRGWGARQGGSDVIALATFALLGRLLPDDDGPAIVNDLRRMLDLALGLGIPRCRMSGRRCRDAAAPSMRRALRPRPNLWITCGEVLNRKGTGLACAQGIGRDGGTPWRR